MATCPAKTGSRGFIDSQGDLRWRVGTNRPGRHVRTVPLCAHTPRSLFQVPAPLRQSSSSQALSHWERAACYGHVRQPKSTGSAGTIEDDCEAHDGDRSVSCGRSQAQRPRCQCPSTLGGIDLNDVGVVTSGPHGSRPAVRSGPFVSVPDAEEADVADVTIGHGTMLASPY